MRPLVLALLLLACSSEKEPPGPVLSGFQCGGIAGDMCPPASTCGECDGYDCSSSCYANVACDPAAPRCPFAYVCDAGSRRCMPKKTCGRHDECAANELCVTTNMSNGICAMVATTAPSTCSTTSPCPLGWTCTASGCRLPCIDGKCPGSLTCTEHECR